MGLFPLIFFPPSLPPHSSCFIPPIFAALVMIDECIMKQELEAGEINAHSSEVCACMCGVCVSTVGQFVKKLDMFIVLGAEGCTRSRSAFL